MNHFWEWAVTLLPMWLAPNLITTFSFCHAVVAHLLIQYYSPNLINAAPRWVYILIGYLMFMYQTFDAIDGKQARRTKTGSPLGQLFDHGCDAITSWIMGIFVCATLQSGPTFLSYLLLCMALVPFFMANWEESCTSIFRFGIIGVTEGQLMIIAAMVATGVFGTEMWSWSVFPLIGVDQWKSFTLFHLLFVCASIGGIYQTLSTIGIVMKYYAKNPAESREQAIAAFLQYAFTIVLGGLWASAPSGAMQLHPRIILCVIGALTSYQASRLIICHTTGEHYSRFFPIMWPLPLVVFNEWSGRVLHGKDSAVFVDSNVVAWCYTAYVVGFYVHFILVTINQITNFLGIKCFTIKPKAQRTQ